MANSAHQSTVALGWGLEELWDKNWREKRDEKDRNGKIYILEALKIFYWIEKLKNDRLVKRTYKITAVQSV